MRLFILFVWFFRSLLFQVRKFVVQLRQLWSLIYVLSKHMILLILG